MKHLIARAVIAAAALAPLALITVSPPARTADAQQEAPPPQPVIIDTLTATVTSYSSDPDQTDDTPDVTASGIHVHQGTLACPKRYAFGTKVLIAGKQYICEDRMNPRYPDRFDVWSPTKEAATAWGIQTLTVAIEQ